VNTRPDRRKNLLSNGWPRVIGKIYSIRLPSAVTLGGANNRGADSPVGEEGHVICCSGR